MGSMNCTQNHGTCLYNCKEQDFEPVSNITRRINRTRQAFRRYSSIKKSYNMEILRRRPRGITKTYLYNFDPLKPHFYIVKLGFTGVYISFLISAQNIDCGYSLEPPRRGGSNEYPNLCFEQKYEKYQRFLPEKISVFGGEIFYIFQ